MNYVKYFLSICSITIFVAGVNAQEMGSVKIGKQTWMTENLGVSHYLNGDSIPQITSSSGWDTLKTGAWCWYDNDSVKYSKYGKLYNWYAVNDPRGFAPAGWHVPSRSEWGNLINYLGGNVEAARKMMTKGAWIYDSLGRITNSSGFSALPSGRRFDYYKILESGFKGIGRVGYWWTSNSTFPQDGVESRLAQYRYLYFDMGYILTRWEVTEKCVFMSVRCLKN